MKNLFRLSLAVCVSLLFGCMSNGDDDRTFVLPPIKSYPEGEGYVSSSIIPNSVRTQLEALGMPVYSGTTPPDISGQYLVNTLSLVGSSDNDYEVGHVFADQYIAFIMGPDGKITYREKQGGGSSESEDVFVEIIGNSNYFTAYFVATGVSRDISTKQSTVISGTMTSEGIKDYYYTFIMLEKGPDPDNKLVPVNTFRVFKDGNGLASKYTWF